MTVDMQSADASALPDSPDTRDPVARPAGLDERGDYMTYRARWLAGWVRQNLREGSDYGTITISGRATKPSLFKPGAEKLCLLFQATPRFRPDSATRAMAGNPAGLFAYRCLLINPAGEILGEGRGAADLAERGKTWTVNNAVKIALKRAMCDAVLRAFALSEHFTQDLEDQAAEGIEPAPPGRVYGPPGPVPAAPAAPGDEKAGLKAEINALQDRLAIPNDRFFASVQAELGQAYRDLDVAQLTQLRDRMRARAQQRKV